MRKYTLKECNHCHGLGQVKRIQYPYKYSLEDCEKALELHNSGQSLRAVADQLNLKHPQIAKMLIMRALNNADY